jgi:hypothetical protein
MLASQSVDDTDEVSYWTHSGMLLGIPYACSEISLGVGSDDDYLEDARTTGIVCWDFAELESDEASAKCWLAASQAIDKLGQ